jgi:hypothetical protein
MIATTMNRVQEHTPWDKNLHPLSLAHNTSVHAETKEFPFFLAHGRDTRFILDMDTEAVRPLYQSRFVQAKDAIGPQGH